MRVQEHGVINGGCGLSTWTQEEMCVQERGVIIGGCGYSTWKQEGMYVQEHVINGAHGYLTWEQEETCVQEYSVKWWVWLLYMETGRDICTRIWCKMVDVVTLHGNGKRCMYKNMVL